MILSCLGQDHITMLGCSWVSRARLSLSHSHHFKSLFMLVRSVERSMEVCRFAIIKVRENFHHSSLHRGDVWPSYRAA